MVFIALLPLIREAGASQRAFPVSDWERDTSEKALEQGDISREQGRKTTPLGVVALNQGRKGAEVLSPTNKGRGLCLSPCPLPPAS